MPKAPRHEARYRAVAELIARHRSEYDELIDDELQRLRGYGRRPGMGAPRRLGIREEEQAGAA